MHPTLIVENIQPRTAGESKRLLLCIQNRIVYFGSDPPAFRAERFAWRLDAAGEPVLAGKQARDPALAELLSRPAGNRSSEEALFRRGLRRCSEWMAQGVTDLWVPVFDDLGKARWDRVVSHHPIRRIDSFPTETAEPGEGKEATFWIPAPTKNRLAVWVVTEGRPVYHWEAEARFAENIGKPED